MDDEQNQSASLLIEVGSTGLKRQSGWVNEEWLRDLSGRNGVKKYKEMADNCPVTGAILFAIEMLIRQATWRTEAGGSSNADKEAAEFLSQCLFEDMEMTWSEFISEVLSMLVFGWSYHEIVFKLRRGKTNDSMTCSKFNDGRVGLRKLPIRAQESFERWEFGENGDILGMYQVAPPDYRLRYIPYSKACLFRTKAHKNNPEGRSILRNAYRSYYFKTNIEEIEGIGVERDLAGLPVATVPAEILSPSATQDEKAVLEAIKQIVTRLKRDELEGVVFPAAETSDGRKTGYSLQLLSTGSRRQFDTNAIIERYEKRIAMTVLADFIFLGQSGVGSFALSSDKTELFSLAIGSILDNICEVVNDKVVPLLFSLNAFTGITALPKLVHGDVETPNLVELGQYITSLSGAGAPLFPNDELTNHLLQVAGLPQMTEQQLAEARAAKQEAQRLAQSASMEPMFAKRSRFQKMSSTRRRQLERQFEALKDSLGTEFEKSKKRFQKFLDEYDEADNPPAALLKELSEFEFIGSAVNEVFEPTIQQFLQLGWQDGKSSLANAGANVVDLRYDTHAAAEYAGQHAAKLITQIDDTTRTLIRSNVETAVKNDMSWVEVKDMLKTGYGFSDRRAETIARTETGVVYNIGFCQIGQESGLVKGVIVHDGDGCSECAAVNGEFWTLEDAMANPLEHPNCRREFEYVLEEF